MYNILQMPIQNKLGTLNSTSDNSRRSKQANYKHEEQVPSTEAIVKILIDLHGKDKLTTNQIQDQKDAVHKLIAVCNTGVYVCSYNNAFL